MALVETPPPMATPTQPIHLYPPRYIRTLKSRCILTNDTKCIQKWIEIQLSIIYLYSKLYCNWIPGLVDVRRPLSSSFCLSSTSLCLCVCLSAVLNKNSQPKHTHTQTPTAHQKPREEETKYQKETAVQLPRRRRRYHRHRRRCRHRRVRRPGW